MATLLRIDAIPNCLSHFVKVERSHCVIIFSNAFVELFHFVGINVLIKDATKSRNLFASTLSSHCCLLYSRKESWLVNHKIHTKERLRTCKYWLSERGTVVWITKLTGLWEITPNFMLVLFVLFYLFYFIFICYFFVVVLLTSHTIFWSNQDIDLLLQPIFLYNVRIRG